MTLFDHVRDQLGHNVPFARHVGIVIDHLDADGATATLDLRHETANHIGTLHAGALFTLGETASGAAMAGLLADMLTSIIPVAANARIAYLRPAKGRITARAASDEPAEEVRRRLAADGKARFNVAIGFTDDADTQVASMAVEWHVRQRPGD